MHWSNKYAWKRGTVGAPKANWSSTVITEQTTGCYLPWELDDVANDGGASWWMDVGLPLRSYSNCLLNILIYLNQKMGGRSSQQKQAFLLLTLLKVDLLASNHRSEKVDGHLGFLPDWPLGSNRPWQVMAQDFLNDPQNSLFHVVLSNCSSYARTPLYLKPVFPNLVYPKPPTMNW